MSTFTFTPNPNPISIQEVEERRRIQVEVAGLLAVDNIYRDKETQYIFDDYINGVYATGDEAIEALKKHYGIKG